MPTLVHCVSKTLRDISTARRYTIVRPSAAAVSAAAVAGGGCREDDVAVGGCSKLCVYFRFDYTSS